MSGHGFVVGFSIVAEKRLQLHQCEYFTTDAIGSTCQDPFRSAREKEDESQ